MNFEFKKGTLLSEDVEAIVNTVNTVGIMGKGIALQFKEKFPLNYKLYRKACDNKEVVVGKMFVTQTGQITNPKYIINFPTKQHWKGASKIEFVEEGLIDLVKVIKELNIKSIAIPPLGCGNGGLQWSIVKPLIMSKIESITDVSFVIFEPSDVAYKAPRERVKPAPKLTSLRAIVLNAIIQYNQLGYELTILEMQKIVYLLQRLGLNFNLQFQRNKFGPFAEKLNYVLNDLDGYYLNGMKHNEAKPFDKISINEEKIGEIKDFIKENCTEEEKSKMELLSRLIDGFESPLGMELLATIDMIILENPTLKFKNDIIQKEVELWNERKAKLMKPEYITITTKRLEENQNYLYTN